MSRSAPERWPISSRRAVKSGISTRLLMPRAHPLRRRRKPAHRFGDGARQQRREQHGDAAPRSRRCESTTRRSAHSTSSISPPDRGEHQRAEHRPEALHRHRDRHDDLARLVDAHDARPTRRSRPPRPRRIPCRCRGRSPSAADSRPEEIIARPLPPAHQDVRLPRVERRQFRLHDLAAAIEEARSRPPDCRPDRSPAPGSWCWRGAAAAPAPRSPD